MPGMAAFKLSIIIVQGETFSKVSTWMAGTPPVPVDLTGCTARMHVRDAVASADVLLALTTENGRITLGGTAGTVTLQLSAAETAAITWQRGVYDLEIVHANATVRRLLAGTIKLSPEVTRA